MAPTTFRLSEKQTLAMHSINRPDVAEMLYGGAKGGAKSVFLCYWMYLSAVELAKKYVPYPRQYPIPIGWLGRKIAKHFEETTLDTWKRFIPANGYRLVGKPPDIIIADRVLIRTGGLDRTESLQKFNSAEFAIIGVDQAEETSRDDVGVLRATRRLVIDGHPIPGKIVYTANPADCWLKEDFIDAPASGRIFIPALAKDNPWLPDNYIKILEDSFSHRPDLLRAYRDGDWTNLSGVDQIIWAEWIAAARMRIGHANYVKRLVSIDPARYGDDLCVVLGLENTRILGAEVLPQCSATDAANSAETMAHAMGDCPIVVESVGMDGISDIIADHGCRVIRYNPSEASACPEKYYNKRAEAFSTVAKWFQRGVWDTTAGQFVSLPEADGRYEDDGRESVLWSAWHNVTKQLTWFKYKFRGERVLVQPKEEIKEEHDGKSPDYADAYVNGLFHLPMVEKYEVRPRHKQGRNRPQRSGLRM